MLREWLRLYREGRDEYLRGPTPDWPAINDYYELTEAMHECPWLDEEAYFAGPFQRYLELCADPTENARVRARTMEFARGVPTAFVERWGADAAAVHARARSIAEAWFADKPDGEYMLEVFDGVSTHNYRVTRAG